MWHLWFLRFWGFFCKTSHRRSLKPWPGQLFLFIHLFYPSKLLLSPHSMLIFSINRKKHLNAIILLTHLICLWTISPCLIQFKPISKQIYHVFSVMTHWSRCSTFVNHLAIAQKAVEEAYCKCRHIWALRSAPSRSFWASEAAFVSCFASSAAWGIACMWDQTQADLNLWIWECELIDNRRCVQRPQNKTMLSWRYKVFLRNFWWTPAQPRCAWEALQHFTWTTNLL